jgi:anti-sigma28 factor (negative regulator of flagellin synthesis)
MNLTSFPLALSTLTLPSKRKADAFEADNDNSENIDPIIFLSPKRSKNPDGSSKDLLKPTNFFLTKAPPSPNEFSLKSTTSPRRPILPAHSLTPRLDTSKSTPLSAPAGRSPTHKRIGILNRRKTGTPFRRVDPPKFSAPSSGLGFSIDAALSGTIPSYSSRQHDPSSPKELPTKDSWFFDIHEDTEVELATNLLEHSTCTLDISSDEESRARKRDCRGKENVPPPDDVSQTRTSLSSSLVNTAEVESRDVKKRARAARMKRKVEEGAIEVDRAPLGDLVVEEF